VKVDGGSTSQHISGLLFALPVVQGDSHVEVANPQSKPYLQMTLSTLERFGVRIEHDERLTDFFVRGGQSFVPVHYRLEGDWSGAAFMLVAGAIAGRVTVENLNSDSLQADRAVLDALRQCGADVLSDAAAVTVRKNELRAFEFDAHDSPDLVPPLAVLACYCQGTSLISGTDRLKIKESNRTRALISELTKMGAHVSEQKDCLRISGGPLKGASVLTQGDHRIAMAAAVAALGAKQETALDDAECVSKSYPNFFQDLETIGVKK
jgi:3-phosphoshikimate 1-carboxyvinyltransferase